MDHEHDIHGVTSHTYHLENAKISLLSSAILSKNVSTRSWFSLKIYHFLTLLLFRWIVDMMRQLIIKILNLKHCYLPYNVERKIRIQKLCYPKLPGMSLILKFFLQITLDFCFTKDLGIFRRRYGKSWMKNWYVTFASTIWTK